MTLMDFSHDPPMDFSHLGLRDRAIAVAAAKNMEWERKYHEEIAANLAVLDREGRGSIVAFAGTDEFSWGSPELDEGSTTLGRIDALSPDGILLRYRRRGGYGSGVHVVVLCTRCRTELEQKVYDLAALGDVLREGAQHTSCPEPEKVAAVAAAAEGRPITTAENALIEALMAVLRERGLPETY